MPDATLAAPARPAGTDPLLLGERVRAVLGLRRGPLTPSEAALLAEIEDLAATVAGARAQIAAIGADHITASHIPMATDELDAIITHTAAATDSILGCCEQLEALAPGLAAAPSAAVQACVTRIYEACGFQDITGQRITKVVAALQAIERRIAHMLEVLAPDGVGAASRGGPAPPPRGLLNGPQLPASAMDQADIDALLASFD